MLRRLAMGDLERLTSTIQEQIAHQGWSCVSTGVNPGDRNALESLFAKVEPVLSSVSPERQPEFSVISPAISAATLAGSERGMSFHTDNVYLDRPCNSVALFCVRQAEKGGENELVDGHAVLQGISTDTRYVLREPRWNWQNPTTSKASDRFSVINDDAESLRWWRKTLLVKDLGLLAIADELEEEINASKSRHMIRLSPGDMLVTDNKRILHNRHAFSGRREMYRVRYW